MNPVLTLLASGYRRTMAVRSSAYRSGWFKSRKLQRPVVSVGNLTVGGTGKTPLVAYVAKLLLKHGLKPAILTRGYGRRRGPRLIVVEPAPSRAPDPREVGDEPALLGTTLPQVPIVAGADRYRAGRLAEEQFRVDLHLLDDGFQHLALARDVDVVALDVTQPLSDHAVLPAGRLREPCSALKRAHIIVLTRVELGDPEGLGKTVTRIHPDARVVHSRTKLSGLLEVASGRRLPPDALEGRRVCAFCAIGNPQAFFRNLRRWGLTIVGEHAFRDHHVYSEVDIAFLVLSARQAGASTLLTTEKDVMNLPPAWKPDLNAFACLIETEMLDGAAFEQALFAYLGGAHQ